APSPEVMKNYYKVIEFLKTRISPKNIDWQSIDRTVQESKESIHTYYERCWRLLRSTVARKQLNQKTCCI
ncbi:hypothetical protein NDU88_002662, partial [Pleurodeles waltl]